VYPLLSRLKTLGWCGASGWSRRRTSAEILRADGGRKTAGAEMRDVDALFGEHGWLLAPLGGGSR